MTQTMRRSLSLVVLLLGTITVYADTQDGKPWVWDDQERFRSAPDGASSCNSMNGRFGSHITCKIDHASFDKHLATEVAKPRIGDRDTLDPKTYCGELSWYFMSGQETLSNFPDAKECPDCVAELKQRVKTLECRFDEGTGSPSVALDKSTLVITMRRMDGGASGWMGPALRKLLPAYDKYLVAHS
ncbi:MAG TPA: hypothetical protein VH143_00895 [Kofleriaceae bacterium]|jgi:hypothetical protein|nr:hypothetical protein [Kofleriaceae bacterium]